MDSPTYTMKIYNNEELQKSKKEKTNEGQKM